MTKIDPIIAVSDVNESAKWFQTVFDCTRKHGGNEFAVLVDELGEVLLCLHKWGAHEHPTMVDPTIKPGNGFILYYKTTNLDKVRQNLRNMDYPIEQDVHLNANSGKKEFSVIDRDGYFWTISEYHAYEG